MTLYNADGSPSELSGNGLRCLAALVLHLRQRQSRAAHRGPRRHRRGLEDADARGAQRQGATRFARRWGSRPMCARRSSTSPASASRVTTLGMGNPQCVALVDDAAGPRALPPARAGARHAPAVSGRHERRVRARRGARQRPDSDLGARRRPDDGVGHRRVRVGGGRHRARRRGARPRRDRAGRHAARRVARRRRVSDRLGGSGLRRIVDARERGCRA